MRIICLGKVYRRDILDATHSPMFHQVEGLAVDKHITMADLKATLQLFAARDVRARVHRALPPVVLPVHRALRRGGRALLQVRRGGCRFCKESGWLEILGSGMVHPNVLRNVGYDPEEVTGWAFGMGVDRIALLKYEIDDIRLFFENDLRFLQQFAGLPGR